MDILRTCTSGVHIIDGFGIVRYKVFGIDKNPEPVKRTYVARWEMLDIEYNARKSGRLVLTDFKKLQLWAFERTQSTGASSVLASNESFELQSDSNLQCIHSGEFRISELQNDPVSARSVNAEPFTAREIYNYFVTACLRSLSFQIAGQQNVVPLNAHCFVIHHQRRHESGILKAHRLPGQHRCRILTLKIQLTEHGYLQIAAKSSEQRLKCIAELSRRERENDELQPPWLVFIAPSSRLARTTWREGMLSSSATSTSTESKPQLSAEWLFSEPQQRIWKRTVMQWLQWQGLRFSSLGIEQDWAKITVFLKFPHRDDATPRSRVGADRLTLDWPAQLCYLHDRGSKRSVECFNPESFGDEILDGTQWFQSMTGDGFHDPLKSAFSWMEEKTQLESEMHARKARIEAAKDETVAQDVSIELFDPQSPLDARAMSYQDAQIIYPTPSDGLPAHVTPGSTSFDNGPLQSSHVPEIGSSPEMDLGDMVSKVPSFGGINNFMPDQNYDGDDHYFGPTALTDADFEFFDQPDLDASEGQSDKMVIDGAVDEDTVNDAGASKIAIRGIDNQEGVSDGVGSSSEPGLANTDMTGKVKLHAGLQQNDDNMEAEDDSHSIDLGVQMELDARKDSLDSSNISSGGAIDPARNSDVLLNNRGEHTHSINRTDIENVPTFDDEKYLSSGRFGFMLRKRFTQSPMNHRGGQNRRLVPTEFCSPTSIKNTTASNQKRIWSQARRSKRLTHEESSVSSESDSSQSDVNENSSKHLSKTTVKPTKPDLLASNSNDDITPTKSMSRATEPSGNHKYWSIDDFDALAGMMLMGYFKSPPTNWALTHFLTADPVGPYYGLDFGTIEPLDIVQIAQILADQVALSFPIISRIEALERPKKVDEAEDDFEVSSSSYINEAIKEIFPASKSIEQNLFNFMSSTSALEDDDEAMDIFSIASAQVQLQRSRQPWNFQSSAPAFWETLGLEPAHGSKEIHVFCIYPWSEKIEVCIDNFMETMESAWLNQKLGCHEPGHLDELGYNGRVPVKVEGEKTSVKDAMTAISDVCITLGSRLKDIYGREERILIYMINPFDDATALTGLCSGFWALIRGYNGNTTIAGRVDARNISLQIVPIDLIASVDSPVSIDPETANSLAHSVYDHCWLSEIALEQTDLPIPSGASIVLGEPAPQAVCFQLSMMAPSNVLNEDSCLHVAYCESHDRSWVAVAWTDSTGEYQHNACYHLGGFQTGGSVIKEMWETTLEIIRPRRVHWRLFIAKCGLLNPSEQKIWHALSSSSTGMSHKLSIISVNTSPTLTVAIKPSIKAALMDNPVPTINTYSTPVSTPHPQQMGSSPAPASPSNFMAASTPSALPNADQATAADADQLTQLIDRTDESWGIILQRRLNVSESLVEYNPALASGFLMKRTGASELDPPVLMEVNLVHHPDIGRGTTAVQETEQPDDGRRNVHKALLREILVMYRNLGLLARLRHIEGRDSCAPWHIAVATNAAEGLGRCMKL